MDKCYSETMPNYGCQNPKADLCFDLQKADNKTADCHKRKVFIFIHCAITSDWIYEIRRDRTNTVFHMHFTCALN